MTLAWIRFALVAALLLAGLFFFCAGVAGTFRLRYALNRMHAAGMLDTAGLMTLTLALALFCGLSVTSGKLLLAVLVQWCTCPVSSHLLARMAVFAEGEGIKEHMEVHRP